LFNKTKQITLNKEIMKKLSNVSPFLLLLFPVFIMMVLAFATGNATATNDEVALKTSTSAGNTIVKATAAILK
jgi:hypothetical protein